MATTINASLSSGAVITPDTSGILQLQSNGTTIATIGPTGLSTQVGAPTFSAYLSANQTPITSATATKILFNIEEFDTNNNFASSRFTPTVAGYYQINAYCAFTSSVGWTDVFCAIYKNGSSYKLGTYISRVTTSQDGDTTVSDVVYLNGSTDYVEIYGYIQGTGTLSFIGGSAPSRTYFSGAMVRSA